jgi:DNA-binding NtrC family response regulator
VNCVAVQDEMIESTLFGHEKGAFTGAISRRIGRLESAHGGTAFLDEIGDISPKMQAKLLHFLESGEFERLGGTRTLRVDCRIVAATHRDLPGEIRAGRFREDLYFRLNVIGIHVPPLRERREDVAALIDGFVDRFAREAKRPRTTLDPATRAQLEAYDWPGNVRQLKNAIERMVVLAPGERLTPDLLPAEIAGGAPGPRPPGPGSEATPPNRSARPSGVPPTTSPALARTGGRHACGRSSRRAAHAPEPVAARMRRRRRTSNPLTPGLIVSTGSACAPRALRAVAADAH